MFDPTPAGASSQPIYVLREEQLVELRPSDYTNEALLQRLVADFPHLLAGEEIGETPRHWLLIGREYRVPDRPDVLTRWALDHLFLDQDAVPTLVEVKLQGDTRIRREVVGQLLDYAANAVVYWPIEQLRKRFAAECGDGEDPDAKVLELVGSELDVEGFWQRAEDNLRAGRLRLVFLADAIPGELRRVIEFLNGQMLAEVIGIEVKQYAGTDSAGAPVQTLVPRIVGQTAQATSRKPQRPGRQWNEERFFATLAEKRGGAETATGRRLYEWASENGFTHSFGRGTVDGSWLPTLNANGLAYRPLTVWTHGVVGISFGGLTTRPPFDQTSERVELLQRLNEIPGLSLPDNVIERYPSFPLAILAADPAALAQMQTALGWFRSRVIDPR